MSKNGNVNGSVNESVNEEKKIYKKVVLVGWLGVGKTTYITHMRTNNFTKNYIPTMGVEISPLSIPNVGDFNIWDCAGQAGFIGLGDGYWNNANAFIIMFDVTCLASYYIAKNYILKVREFMDKKLKKNVPLVLVGNKTKDEERKVPYTMVQKDNDGFYSYVEISSKTLYNAKLPFQKISQ